MVENNQTKKAAVSSVFWSFVEKMSVQGITFVISLILARLLMPEDYGIIAIITLFINIAQVFIDGGILKALVQRQMCSQEDYSTAFYTNLGLGCVCYAAMWIASPFMAEFFNMPLLTDTTRILSLQLIIASLTIVQRARYQIAYNFKVIAVISLASIIVGGGCGLWMAYHGYGVWALVWYYLVGEIIRGSLFWILGHWSPSFIFSKASCKKIFGFGLNLLAANIIHVVIYNLYTFVIGKMFSASALGIFSKGQALSRLIPTNLSSIVEQASYPVFCSLKDDQTRLRSFFGRYVEVSFALVAPLMTILIVLAKPIVLLVLTEKWLSTVFFIQVLGLGYMLDPVMRLNAIVVNTTGISRYSLYSEIGKKFALVIIIAITASIGLEAMAWGLLANSFVDLFVVTKYVKRVVGISLWGEFRLMLPNMLYCILIYVIVEITKNLIDDIWIQIAFGTLEGLLIYLLCVFIFSKKQYRYIVEILDLVKNRATTSNSQ